MAKGIREKIRLVSSAGTGHFYTTDKNKLQWCRANLRSKVWSSSSLPTRYVQRSENQVIDAFFGSSSVEENWNPAFTAGFFYI